jgi:hypothetical protein
MSVRDANFDFFEKGFALERGLKKYFHGFGRNFIKAGARRSGKVAVHH